MLDLVRELCQDELGEELGNLLCASNVPSLIEFMIKIFSCRHRLSSRAVVCACNILITMFLDVCPDECINCLLHNKDEIIYKLPKRYKTSDFAENNSRITTQETEAKRPRKRRRK